MPSTWQTRWRWSMPEIPIPKRWRQDDKKSKVMLSYMVSLRPYQYTYYPATKIKISHLNFIGTVEAFMNVWRANVILGWHGYKHVKDSVPQACGNDKAFIPGSGSEGWQRLLLVILQVLTGSTNDWKWLTSVQKLATVASSFQMFIAWDCSPTVSSNYS